MKYFCLAYGDEAGWNSLSDDEKQEVLSNDKVITNRGDLMSAVEPKVTTVRNWDNELEVKDGPVARMELPLAGFSIIQADSIEEVIELVKNTPCSRAQGYIEIRQFWHDDGLST